MAQDFRAIGPTLLLSLAIVATVSVAGRLWFDDIQAAEIQQSSAIFACK